MSGVANADAVGLVPNPNLVPRPGGAFQPPRPLDPPRGRPVGSTKFDQTQINCLFHFARQFLPAGDDTWELVCTEYNYVAISRGFPERDSKSLKAKFRSFVAAKKPTGITRVPKNVTEALEIERLIEESVEMGHYNGREDPESDEETAVQDLDVAHNARVAPVRVEPSVGAPPHGDADALQIEAVNSVRIFTAEPHPNFQIHGEIHVTFRAVSEL